MAIGLGTVAETTAQELRITAREVVAEMQKQVGVEWKKETVDTFKAGTLIPSHGNCSDRDGDDRCSANAHRHRH